MIKNIYIWLVLLALLCVTQAAHSQVNFNQVPNDDLGNFEDKFQEYFYEAIKQRSIENYNRANDALQKCLMFNDDEPVIYFEMAKNYVELKNFGAAEDALKKAIAKDEDNEWYLDELYGVYVELNDYDKALKTVKDLVKFHPDYKEDLANLYYRNKRYKQALRVLDELDNDRGVSESRDYLRNRIYNATGADDDRIEYLEERIVKNPSDESNYLNLIYRYSEQGDKDKAFDTAKLLLERSPNSQLVHLALYKFYLEENDPDKAIKSMKLVVKSDAIKPDAKAKVLNDFVKFVRENPQYEADLLEATQQIKHDDTGQSEEELAIYYLQSNNKLKALDHYKKALEKDPNNFAIIKNVLMLQIDQNKYKEAKLLSQIALENYPSQPILYLANGVANNKLNQSKEAIEALETGIDYVFDDITMEIDFYKQLSAAYKLNNNITKSQAFAKKADDLLKQND